MKEVCILRFFVPLPAGIIELHFIGTTLGNPITNGAILLNDHPHLTDTQYLHHLSRVGKT
jgi:hypothetical protein